jgi:hypothetical protein
MYEAINLKIISHTWDELVNGYLAINLADGTSNMTLYDSKAVAIRHTDETRHAYFCFRQAPGGVNVKDCQIFLNVWRWSMEHGATWNDPDAKRQPDIIISTYGHDVLSGKVDPRYKP